MSGPPSDGPEVSGTDTGGENTNDDTGGGTEVPDREPPSPTPDATTVAFEAISPGDCLEVYDTGYAGTTRVDWSADVPPNPVSCTSGAGFVQVTSTGAGTCPHGVGQASWSYTSPVSGETTTLCVTRIYRQYYCLLGVQEGGTTRLGSLTAVDCEADRIPAAYNRIIHVLGVYQAPPNAGAHHCVQGTNDRTQYLSWMVNDNRTLLCTTIFRGS